MECPKCSADCPDGALECPHCGIVFSRYNRLRETPPAPRPSRPPAPPYAGADPWQSDPPAADPEDEGRLSKEGLISVGGGFGLAVLFYAIPFARFLLGYLGILVHELGHAIFSWLFGYPAIPAFDFSYGGGFTPSWPRNTALMVVIYLAWGGAFYLYRRNRLTLVVLGVAVALYTIAAFTAIHEVIFLFMGHGTELVFSAIFLFRAVKGSAITHKVERPLYAMLGFFLLFANLAMGHLLITSKSYRQDYYDAKGGGGWMDFSRIADELLGVELPTVALLQLGACVLAPLGAWLVFRHEQAIRRGLARILVTRP